MSYTDDTRYRRIEDMTLVEEFFKIFNESEQLDLIDSMDGVELEEIEWEKGDKGEKSFIEYSLNVDPVINPFTREKSDNYSSLRVSWKEVEWDHDFDGVADASNDPDDGHTVNVYSATAVHLVDPEITYHWYDELDDTLKEISVKEFLRVNKIVSQEYLNEIEKIAIKKAEEKVYEWDAEGESASYSEYMNEPQEPDYDYDDSRW